MSTLYPLNAFLTPNTTKAIATMRSAGFPRADAARMASPARTKARRATRTETPIEYGVSSGLSCAAWARKNIGARASPQPLKQSGCSRGVKHSGGLAITIRTLATALALSTVLLLAFAPTAAAHASANSADGNVRVTWGLLEEPGFTNEKTRLDLIIRENATGAGIGGLTAENITELALHYGEEEYDLGNITVNRGVKSGAFAGPGNYTSQFYVYLTRPGIYTLHIQGTIAGSEVDLEIPATHEYEPMTEIMFPEKIEPGGAGDLSALEARIAALEAKTQTMAQTPATLTPQDTAPPTKDAPALGVLVVMAAAVAVALARRK